MAELQFSFIPAPNDAPTNSIEYQQELLQFENAAHAQKLTIASRVTFQKFMGGQNVSLGEFTIKLAEIVVPALGTALGTIIGAWLQARSGRKVRLKVGEVEAEAQTVEDVEKLIARAQDIQRSRLGAC
jgi:hypothetical protein